MELYLRIITVVIIFIVLLAGASESVAVGLNISDAGGYINHLWYDPLDNNYSNQQSVHISSKSVSAIAVDHVTAANAFNRVHLHAGRDDAVSGPTDLGFIEHVTYSYDTDDLNGFELEPSNPSIISLIVDEINSTGTDVMVFCGRGDGGLLPMLYNYDHGIYYETTFANPGQQHPIVDIDLDTTVRTSGGMAHLFLSRYESPNPIGGGKVQHVIYDHTTTSISWSTAWMVESGPINNLEIDRQKSAEPYIYMFFARNDGLAQVYRFNYDLSSWSFLANGTFGNNPETGYLVIDDHVENDPDIVHLHIARGSGQITHLLYNYNTGTFSGYQSSTSIGAAYTTIILDRNNSEPDKTLFHVGRSDGVVECIVYDYTTNTYSSQSSHLVRAASTLNTIALDTRWCGAILADLNQDCRVDHFDMMDFTDNWLNEITPPCDGVGDLNGDCITNNEDMSQISASWLIDKQALPTYTDDAKFGFAVALSGSTAVIGAYGDDAAGLEAGAAYLYDVTTGNQLRQLSGDDVTAGDRFGCSVGISGNVAIVGAYGHDSGPGMESGAAYVFDVTTGNQLAKLTASDADAGDRFGCAVAISGDWAIVGAYGVDSAIIENSGAAYMFDLTTFSQTNKFLPTHLSTSTERDSGLGASVAIDGNKAIVGSWADNDNGYIAGSMYTYQYNGSNWTLLRKTKQGISDDLFGWSVAVSGDTIAVGAHKYDEGGVGGITDIGTAYLFNASTGVMQHQLSGNSVGSRDWFGYSAGIDGSLAIIGMYEDGDLSADTGAAYLFNTATGNQTFRLTATDGQVGNHFGHAVAISGNIAIVGAYGDDDHDKDSGAVYVFDTTTGNQLRKITISD